MSEELWKTFITNLPAIIGAIGGVIAAIGAILAAYWSYNAKMQSAANSEKLQATEQKAQQVLARQAAQDGNWEQFKAEYKKLGEIENASKEAGTNTR